jgi:hypothetical protein
MYKDRIKHLEEAHRAIDKQLTEMDKHPHVEESKIAEMKKQKLQLKDEINRLNKLQWDHEHEHINLDDDR